VSNFNPIETPFSSDVDPITADEHGLAILDKLKEGEMLPQNDPAIFKPERDKLLKNLKSYADHKAKRGEELFSYESDVVARKKGLKDRELSRRTANLWTAGKTSFDTILKERGAYDDYKALATSDDDTELRNAWMLRESLKEFGYSSEAINSGYAEADLRSRINVGEDEPTGEGLKRWGLATKNEYDRRQNIVDHARKTATTMFMGITGSPDEFEKAMSKEFPHLTNDERTTVRKNYNSMYSNFQKEHSLVSPLVKKAFNTISVTEGTALVFEGEDSKPYQTVEEAVDAFAKLPRKEFPKAVQMMALTAEAHGQDVDGVMNKIHKSFARGLVDLGAGFKTGMMRKYTRSVTKSLKAGEDMAVIFEPDGTIAYAAPYDRSTNAETDELMDLIIGKGALDKKTGTPGRYYKRITGQSEHRQAAIEFAEYQERIHDYSSELRNWKENVAKVGSDNWFMNDWVYGTARSLPEMGAAATGFAGFLLVAGAQYERNYSEYQRANPHLSREEIEKADAALITGAAFYSGLNRLQFNTLAKKLPQTKSFTLELLKRTATEAVQETGQDLSYSTSLEFYSKINEDIKDLEWKSEVWEGIKRFPRTMFAVAPLAIGGAIGRKAFDYMDEKAFANILKDTELLELYGLDAEDISEVQKMTPRDAADYLQEHSDRHLENLKELKVDGVQNPSELQVQVAYDPETKEFTVSNQERSIKAKTAEEAAEAAQQLDPELNPQNLSAPMLQEMQDLATEGRVIESASELSEIRHSTNSPNNQTESSELNKNTPLENWGKTLSPAIEVTSPVGHPDITKKLIKSLETLKIFSGVRYAGAKRLGAGVSGTYNFVEGVLRVAQHGNVSTAAHEMAHAIQDQFLYPGVRLGDANWKDDKLVSDKMESELASIADNYYGEGTMGGALRKQNILLSEGFAEYIRLRMQGDKTFSAPNVDAWFKKHVLDANPEFNKAFTEASKLMQEYDLQGSINRMRGNVAKSKTPIDKAKAAVVEAQGSAVTKMVESLTPLKKISKMVEGMTGKVLPDTMNPYLIAKRRRYTHSAVTAQMVETGMVDFNGNIKGERTSLKYALKDIKDSERMDFTIYLWARRALSLQKKNINAGVTVEDAAQVFSELDNPRFERAAGLVYDWNDAVLQYAADSSGDYAEIVASIRELDAGQYIPLAREFESFQKRYSSISGSATSANLVKRLKGSGRRIRDPFESMVSNAEKLVLRAHERNIIETLLDLKDLKDPTGQPIKFGAIITKADPTTIPVANRNVVDLLGQVSQTLDEEFSDAAKELADLVADSDQADAMVTLWGQAYNPPNKLENPVIPIYRNGKREFYEVDRNAYEALGGLDMYRANDILMKVASGTTQLWRVGTTGYNATFQMVTNPLRDVRTLYQQTQSEAGFLRIMGTWSATMAGGVIEGVSAKHIQSDWSKLYDALGLEMVSPLGQDANYTRKAVRNLFTTSGVKKVIRTLHPGNVGAYLRDSIQYAEKATRLTELKLIAKEIGFDPTKDELTPEIAQKLALAAREVTTDFTASGSVGKAINQVLPFWNSQVQGVRAHVRSYSKAANSLEGKGKAHQYLFNTFMARGLTMSAIGIALWLRNKDEEWWKEMPQEEKYTHSYIPISAEFSLSGEDELLKIPKAFELDGLFMGLPVAVLDSFNESNPNEATAWAKKFVSSAVPNHPVIINYMLESEGKKDFFGRPVIPESEKVLGVDGQRYRQFGARTTEVAMLLGKTFDMSPRRVDHTFKSFFGRAGVDALEVFGTVESDTRDPHITRFPVLGAIFHPKGQNPYSPKSVTKFYQKRQEFAAKASKINRKVEETADERLTRLMFQDANDALTILREVRKGTTNETKIRKLISLETKIAKQAVDSYENGTIDRQQFKQMERELERELSKQKERMKTLQE